MTLTFTIIVFFLGIVFAFTNGFQCGSSVAAIAVNSHSALSKAQISVTMLVFSFVGALLGGSAVSKSIESLNGWQEQPDLLLILTSTLVAAIAWNYIAEYLRLPASSTHALVGAMVGALVAAAGGIEDVQAKGVCMALISLLLSPIVGVIACYLFLFIMMSLMIKCKAKAEQSLRRAQFFTVSALAFSCGQNETQKTMGILVLALSAGRFQYNHDIPTWVRALVGVALAFGMAFIVRSLMKKVGKQIYKLRPEHGVACEASSAMVIMLATIFGGPISASQVVASSVVGAGWAEQKRGIHFVAIKDIVLSWLCTLPASALISGLLYIVVLSRFADALR